MVGCPFIAPRQGRLLCISSNMNISSHSLSDRTYHGGGPPLSHSKGAGTRCYVYTGAGRLGQMCFYCSWIRHRGTTVRLFCFSLKLSLNQLRRSRAQLQADLKKAKHATHLQRADLEDCRSSVYRRIQRLQDLQTHLMPDLRLKLDMTEQAFKGRRSEAEAIPLYLPSSLPPKIRAETCSGNLMDAERQLVRPRLSMRWRAFETTFEQRLS